MTELEFRAAPARVGRLRELLNDPILAQAIVCVKDAESPDDVPDHSDPVASVRTLSRKSGWHGALNMLLALAEPLPPEPITEEPNYGVDLRQFPQAQPT